MLNFGIQDIIHFFFKHKDKKKALLEIKKSYI